MKKFWKYIFKYKLLFFARIVTISLAALSVIAFDFIMGFIVDIFANGETHKFVPIILTSIALIIILFITEYIDGYVMSSYIKNTVNYLRTDIFSKIINKDIKDFALDNSGKYISILYNDLKIIEDSLLNNIFQVISSFISFTISIIFLFSISPTIVIFISIFGTLGFVIPNALSKKLVVERNNFSNNLENITSVTKDLFSGFEVIKGFNIAHKINPIFKNSSTAVESSKKKCSILESIIKGFSLSFSVTIYLGVLILGGYLMNKGEISVGTAIIIIQLSTHIVGPVKTSISLINQIKSVSLIVDKIDEILCDSSEEIEDLSLEKFGKSIEIKNLNFSYSDERQALNNINLTFEKNKKYAIVGESGSGKSTLTKLLMRYYKNYNGEILIDNKNLQKILSHDLYKNISMIQQNVFMFDDSIKENIKLYADYSDDEILEVCGRSGLSNLISILPNGINSLVGENGNKLSGGEKQRIAIARSLINDTKILILDESTSALDNETAYNLETSLLSINDLTLVVVTHKLIKNILLSYDEIIVMKDGMIIEKGSFNDLIELKGYFYSLYYLQNEKI
ncbi:MAG: ABC transporter ATP-binding protein [Peptostreptococcaceae bacterium]|nr:ABC transporter ATP-binding protein [Peptostreptococcaceae bacterium]